MGMSRDPFREPPGEAGPDPLGEDADLDPDPQRDIFHPPSISTLVGCLHCGEEYDSYRIEWRVERRVDGRERGMWCCPIPGCDGAGFGFDIWPVDREWVDPDGRDMGWVEDPPPDPETDLGRPPDDPTPVRCERCGRTCSSADMVWWVDEEAMDDPDAWVDGGWRCPTPGCQGFGFGDDLRPTDPAYVDPPQMHRRIMRPGEKFEPPTWDGDEMDIPF